MKEKYKVALLESIPYFVVLAVIGLGIWLNALIIQDTITLEEAGWLSYKKHRTSNKTLYRK